MKKSELIERLSEFSDDAEIVVWNENEGRLSNDLVIMPDEITVAFNKESVVSIYSE